MKAFLLMLQMLTRIPVNKALPCSQSDFRRGAYWLPAVGLIVGAVAWSIYTLSSMILPSYIAVAIALFVPIIITGAMHVDGLADLCDGLFAPHKDTARRLEIIKDSRIGVFGVCGIAFYLILNGACLYHILPVQPLFLIAVPVAARSFIALACVFGKPATAGSGSLMVSNVSAGAVILNLLLGFCALSLTGWLSYGVIWLYAAAGIMLLTAAATLLLCALCTRRLGGLTGDCLGAAAACAEIIILLSISAWIQNII